MNHESTYLWFPEKLRAEMRISPMLDMGGVFFVFFSPVVLYECP